MREVPLYRGLAGTFTAEKSIKAATEKLDHIASTSPTFFFILSNTLRMGE